MNKPQYIILHTAAHGSQFYNGDTTAAAIDSWHRQNGWRKIGYHGVVKLDGTYEPGRDHDESGAHCTSMKMNSRSLGLCFAGHGDYFEWTPEQRETGLVTIREWMFKYNIPAENVLGHRETGAKKSCPGRKVDLSEVRKELGRLDNLPRVESVKGINATKAKTAFSLLYSLWHDLPPETQKWLNEGRWQHEYFKGL